MEKINVIGITGGAYKASEVDFELNELRARCERLEGALRSMMAFSAEVYALIDADKQVKAMKLAGAMGGNKGYRQDVDKALSALAAADGREDSNV